MYRKAADFLADWTGSAGGTLAVIKAITNEKKHTVIVEGHNSLEWLAWHLVGAGAMFAQIAGLQVQGPAKDEAAPEQAEQLAQRYGKVMQAVAEEAGKLSDAQMEEEINGFMGPVARGAFLRMMIDHQNHHRGQMTVLLRQAGLTVPGVMGPTKEMA